MHHQRLNGHEGNGQASGNATVPATGTGVWPASGGVVNAAGGAESGDDTRPIAVLVELARTTWRHRWVVLGCLMAGLALSAGYAFTATPIFESYSRIAVERRGVQLISDAAGGAIEGRSYLNTQAEILRSTPTLERALSALQPGDMATFGFGDPSLNPLLFLQEELRAEPGRDTDLLRVSLESPYENEAALIVNAVVDAYVASHASQNQSLVQEVRRIFDEEHRELQQEVRLAHQAMLSYKRERPLLAIEGEGGGVLESRFEKLSERRTEVEQAAIEAEAEMFVLGQLLDDPAERHVYLMGRQHTAGSAWSMMMAEVSRIEDERLQLLATATTDHPALEELETKLRVKRLGLESIESTLIRSLYAQAKHRYDQSSRHIEKLDQELAGQELQLRALRTQQAEYEDLEGRWTLARGLAESLYERIKEINVEEQAGSLNIRVVEAARPTGVPIRPRKPQLIAAGMVAGALLGLGLGLLLESLDQSLRRPEDVAEVSGATLLGLIPLMSGRRQEGSPAMIVAEDPKAPVSEAVRTVRTAVVFSAGREGCFKLVVTSPTSGDGKSTVIANLSIALAQAGHRTLLIDADLRKPVQHKQFGLENGVGLSTVLAGRDGASAAIRGVELAPGLDVMPSGPTPPNPSELLGRPAFGALLAELSERYGFILVDSPPLLPVADPRIVASVCDAAVVVVRFEHSNRKSLRHAMEALRSLGVRVLGVVANGIGAGGRYAGYQHYYYRYERTGENGRSRRGSEGRRPGARGTDRTADRAADRAEARG